MNEIVRDRDEIFLRAATVLPVRGDKLTVVSSEALDEEPLMQAIAKDLGEITLYSGGLKLQERARTADSDNASAPLENQNLFDRCATNQRCRRQERR